MKYSGGGVILILQTKNKEKYIVLTKRSDNAPVNPGVHSGFFGGIEKKYKEKNPELIGARELIEEICITSKDYQKIYPLQIKTKPEIPQKIREYPEKHFLRLWRYEKKLNLGSDINFIKEKKRVENISYIEYDGRKKIMVAQFNLKFDLKNIIILDGETCCEKPPCCLLDREIDVFSLKEFKKWWLDGKEKDTLKAKFSFKTAKKNKKGCIKREKNKISPSLVLALNKWWSL